MTERGHPVRDRKIQSPQSTDFGLWTLDLTRGQDVRVPSLSRVIRQDFDLYVKGA